MRLFCGGNLVATRNIICWRSCTATSRPICWSDDGDLLLARLNLAAGVACVGGQPQVKLAARGQSRWDGWTLTSKKRARAESPTALRT